MFSGYDVSRGHMHKPGEPEAKRKSKAHAKSSQSFSIRYHCGSYGRRPRLRAKVFAILAAIEHVNAYV
jgi:hypothetical protein